MFTTRNTCAAAPPPRRRRRCRVTPKFDSVDCRVTDFRKCRKLAGQQMFKQIICHFAVTSTAQQGTGRIMKLF